jgi:annexin A7/11
LSGNFETAVLALLEPIDEYEAKHIRSAIKGLGTNESLIIQILCPKEGHEVEILKAAYKRLYDRNLEEDLSSEQNGYLGRIFRSIATGNRPESSGYDEELAKSEAQELYDAGKGKFGTDESKFIQILCSRSFQQLAATFAAYEQYSKETIEKSIKSEMSGDLEKACLAIVKSVKNKPKYYAELLHEAMAGFGTKDNDLIRLLVSLSEYNMDAVKQQYKLTFGKNLYDVVKSELSGDYEKLFLAIIGKD